jgi:hypothetical protein
MTTKGIQNIKNDIKKVIQSQVKINNRQCKKQSSYCGAQVSPFLPALPLGNITIIQDLCDCIVLTTVKYNLSSYSSIMHYHYGGLRFYSVPSKINSLLISTDKNSRQ